VGRLRNADLLGVLDFVRSIETATGLAEFRTHVFDGLRRLVPYDVGSYNEVELASGAAVAIEDPRGCLLPVYPAFREFMGQHPVIAHVERTGDGRPRKISDFLTAREFHRLDLYDTVFRPSGLRHQISVTLPAARPLVVGIALNSERRDFSERDREILDLVRPHLAQAYRNAELRELSAALAAETETGARGVVMLTPSGRIRAATAEAEWLLLEYFPDAPRAGGLPAPVAGWLTRQRSRASGDEPALVESLVEERDTGRLCVRLVPGGDPEQPDLLVLEERRVALQDSALRRYGLTNRECEVLRLAARGITNPEIAEELFISARTVQKHLEHICEKLGARTRTAAVARAFELSTLGIEAETA
jgi:DNA-binding CsgD family transcriptional regulator